MPEDKRDQLVRYLSKDGKKFKPLKILSKSNLSKSNRSSSRQFRAVTDETAVEDAEQVADEDADSTASWDSSKYCTLSTSLDTNSLFRLNDFSTRSPSFTVCDSILTTPALR